MGDLISYIAHLGIVRVLSVPALIIALIWVLWVLAAPPINDADAQGQG